MFGSAPITPADAPAKSASGHRKCLAARLIRPESFMLPVFPPCGPILDL